MPKKIVIAGCGLVGLETAFLLKKKVKDEANIVVVNDKDFFEFRPWRNIVFRNSVQKDAQIELRSALSGKGIGFVKGTVTGVDMEKKQLKLKTVAEAFDFLIISIGSVVDYKAIPGAQENTLPYFSIKNAFDVKKHVMNTLSSAPSLKGKEKDAAFTIVVCGAGHSGVELMSELNDFLDKCCVEQQVRRIDVKLILIDAQPQILTSFPSKARGYVYNYLARNGIDIRTSTTVNEIKKDRLILADSSIIESKTIIWCGGCKPNPTFKESVLKTDSNGGILVNTYMQTSDAMIYAAGEIASGRGMTANSPDITSVENSLNQAKIIANNVATTILDGNKQEFKHGKTKTMISLGPKNSIIVIGSTVITGIIANIMKNKTESKHFKRLNK